MPKEKENLHRLFAIRSPEVFFLPIAKSGSTFVKNLLWAVDKGSTHPVPNRIHADDHLFLRASDLCTSTDRVRSSELAFAMLRDPISRFLSLYRDKVVGNGWKNFVPLRQHLLDRHGLIEAPGTAAEHRHNARALAEFLRGNLSGEPGLRRNPHWTPQTRRSRLLGAFNLKILATDSASAQITRLLSPHVPNLGNVLASVERNKSERAFPASEIISDDTRSVVEKLFAEDARLHEIASREWRETGEILRYDDLRARVESANGARKQSGR